MTNKGEHDIVKMSSRLMESLGITAQSIVSLKTGSKLLRLRVSLASQEDLDTYGDVTLVARDNYSLLTTKSDKTSLVGIQPFEGLSLGCDPEFFLINRKHSSIQVASHLMREKMNTSLGLRVGPHGYLGTDGNSILAEIRPDPVMLREQGTLLTNIAELIKALVKNRVINPKLTTPEAHSYYNGVAAGFHIHFGLGDVYVNGKGIVDEAQKELADIDSQRKILPALIIKSLDYHLGCLMRLIDPEYGLRSWYSQYGRAADFRLCRYTVEYRVPGGYFLSTPDMTAGLISTAALIVSNTVPLLASLTSGYQQSKVLDKEELERGFNKAFSIPDTMNIKSILDGEETLSSLESSAIVNNVLKNLHGMQGHNQHSKWFISQAQGKLWISDIKLMNTMVSTNSAQPKDLLLAWGKI